MAISCLLMVGVVKVTGLLILLLLYTSKNKCATMRMYTGTANCASIPFVGIGGPLNLYGITQLYIYIYIVSRNDIYIYIVA